MSLKETAAQATARKQRDKVFTQRAIEGSKAMVEYREAEQALRDRTAQLRSDRLAREAAAPNAENVTKQVQPARRPKRIHAR